MMTEKQLVLDFFKSQNLVAISTVASDGRPESAIVEFAETRDLQIIFDTYLQFRKYENLKTNQNVALVFDDRRSITVQYEGHAVELDLPEAETYRNIYLTKLPDARKYVEGPETRWFIVKPRWIRYTDISCEPWRVIEVLP